MPTSQSTTDDLGERVAPHGGSEVLPTHQQARILIIDDEATYATLLKLMLEQTGDYVVMTEHRAARAVETAERFAPDLILLDVIMPDIGGGEIAAQFRDHAVFKHVPIVFITAIVKKTEVEGDLLRISGRVFIPKPVNREELLDVVKRQLHKTRS
jgi:two-component SAPR family response regulator